MVHLKVEDLQSDSPKYYLYGHFEDCRSNIQWSLETLQSKIKSKEKEKNQTNLDLLSIFFNDRWLYLALSSTELGQGAGATQSSSL